MPRVVPSLLIDHFDKAFPAFVTPTLSGPPEIRYTHAASIGGLLRLFDLIPDEHFSQLSGENYALLVSATAQIREVLESWRYMDHTQQRMTGGTPIGNAASLGNRNPLEVFRTVLAMCPDEAPATHIAELSFLGDMAAVIHRDMSTSHSALANGEFKATCVMAGSVIEALLLWALKRRSQQDRDAALDAWRTDPKAAGDGAPKALPADWDAWKLHHLINIARRVTPPLLSARAASVADSARDFRNLIHPERAEKVPPTRGTAQVAVGAMGLVAEELEALTRAGAL